MVDFSSKIRTLRELKKYSQEYMANQLEISQKAYSNMENGVSEMTVARLEKICDILGMSLSEMLNFNEKQVFTNNFHNQTGNQGGNFVLNNNYQQKEIDNLERLLQSKNEEIKAKNELLKAKDEIIASLRVFMPSQG